MADMKDKKEVLAEGSQYDRLFKSNIIKTEMDIIKNVLHLNVTTVKVLTDKIQRIKEREVDLVREVKDENGNRFILQIEFQTNNLVKTMVGRMAEYSIMFRNKYKLPVRQFVIYTGKGKSSMITSIDCKDLKFRYNLVSVSQIDHKVFLKSKNLEGRLYSVLGDFKNNSTDPKRMIMRFLHEIRDLKPLEHEEGYYLTQLHLISKLRNLENYFDMAMKTMNFNDKKDPFFIRGEQQGIQKGEQKILSVAANLKKKGISMEIIAEATELSISEINKL